MSIILRNAEKCTKLLFYMGTFLRFSLKEKIIRVPHLFSSSFRFYRFTKLKSCTNISQAQFYLLSKDKNLEFKSFVLPPRIFFWNIPQQKHREQNPLVAKWNRRVQISLFNISCYFVGIVTTKHQVITLVMQTA